MATALQPIREPRLRTLGATSFVIWAVSVGGCSSRVEFTRPLVAASADAGTPSQSPDAGASMMRPEGPDGGTTAPELPTTTKVVDTLGQVCTGDDNPMPDLRRLTNLSYRQAVERFTGYRVSREDLRQGLPALLRDKTITNVDFGLRTGRVFTLRLIEFAAKIAQDMNFQAFFEDLSNGCEEATAECRSGFVTRALSRALGRAPSSEEIAIYVQVYEEAAGLGMNPLEGARTVTEAILASPLFIMVASDGSGDVGRERAQRISLLLFNEPNHPAVLGAAQAGELDTRAGVERFVRGQLRDGKVSLGLEEFYYDWLNLDRLDSTIDLTSEGYPEYTLATNDALREDVETYLRTLVFEEEQPFVRAFLDRRAFVRPETAWIYGEPRLTPAAGGAMMDLSSVPKRTGLLTTPALAALTLKIESKSIVDRGVFVNEHVLCRDIPIPAAVTPIDQAKFPEDASQRERLADHEQGPCAGCHVMLDAPGYALEMFGPIGELKTEDEWGNVLRDDGTFGVDGQEFPFEDVYAFSDLLARSDELVRCIVQRRLSHALARVALATDAAHQCELSRLESIFRESQFDIRELTVGIATSRYFTP